MLGSATLPQLQDGDGSPGLCTVSQHEVHLNQYVFLQRIILMGEESCQAQCLIAQYILV